jgi:hypothetical protein
VHSIISQPNKTPFEMDHFHDTHCGCSDEEIDRDNAIAMTRVRRDPVAAVRDISNGHPEPVLFQSVVNMSLTEPRIWRAGAATLYSDVLGRASSPEPAEPSPFKPKPGPALTRACSRLGPGFRFRKPKPGAQARPSPSQAQPSAQGRA